MLEVHPYEQHLGSMPIDQRREWSRRVGQQLADLWGAGTIFTVLGGADYVAGVREGKRGRVGNGWLMQQLKQNRRR